MDIGRHQPADNRAVNHGNDGMTGERAGAGGTAHQFIPAKAEAAADNDPNHNAYNHGVIR